MKQPVPRASHGYFGSRALQACLAAGLLIGYSSVHAQGMNLARYGEVRADSTATTPGTVPRRAVDGIVSDSSRWISGEGPGPHWLEVALPGPFAIAAAHVFSGENGANPLTDFAMEYWRNEGWQPIPGATVADNRDTQRAIRFANPVRTDRVRLVVPANGTVAVTELAVFPADCPAPIPIDAGVELEVGLTPIVTASSQRDAASRPFLATDGVAHGTPGWVARDDDAKPWLELEFNQPRTIATAHIYSGMEDGSIPALAACHLEYRQPKADDWLPVPGASVQNNASTTVRLDFPLIQAAAIRLVVDTPQKTAVRELVLLPPNGGKGYPEGTQIRTGPPPTAQFATYWDHLYTLSPGGGLVLGTGRDDVTLRKVAADEPDESQLYHVLNVIGTDFFRIVNRHTNRCLEVAEASREPGAPVREGRYRALDYQLWTIVGTGDSPRQLINVHSGQTLTATGNAAVQQPLADGGANQRWTLAFRHHFPKKGLAEMGTGRKMADQRLSHYYNWGKSPSGDIPESTHHEPMQWGNFGWEEMALLQADWLSTGRPIYLMGFNEPDRPDQAKLSPEDVVRLWSRLEAVELPLVAPAPSWWNNGWTTKFYRLARDRGLRYDCVGIHVYITGGPNASQFMGMCEGAYRNYGRPVWNTEWNIVNWGGPAWWTAAEEYTWMSEILHRMETSKAVARYDFFPFSPQWPNGAPGAPWSDGVTMTPLGRLYGAWDGDMGVRERTWYYLHSQESHQRLAATATAPGLVDIDDMRPPTNWYLASMGNDSFAIVSRDGDRRLAVVDGKLALVARETATPNARWTFVPLEHGWHAVQNVQTGHRLQAHREGDAPALAEADATDASVRWRLIKPYDAGARVGERDSTPPRPAHDLSVAEGYNVVKVNWLNAAPPSDFAGYKLFRSKRRDGPYQLLAENLHTATYVDMDGRNGQAAWYKVTCLDFTGNESPQSEGVSGTPNNWIMVDDRDPAVKLDDKWGTWKGHGGYMRTESFCETKGATASLAFKSDCIRVYAFRRADLGFADILIDGKLVESVDCYAQKTSYHGLVFEKTGLGPGKHTIQVVNAGRQNPSATGFEIILDAFQYVASGPDTTPPPPPTGLHAKPTPTDVEIAWNAVDEPDLVSYSLYRREEANPTFRLLAKGLTTTSYVDKDVRRGVRRLYAVRAIDATGNASERSSEVEASPGIMVKVDDNHKAISYEGRWGTYRGNAGFRSTEHYSESKGAEATFTFTGDSVRYYGHKRDDLGIAEILVDGKHMADIDCFWQTTSFGQLLYENRSLPFGKHTITVRVTGRQNPRATGFEIIVDAFEYKAGAPEEVE